MGLRPALVALLAAVALPVSTAAAYDLGEPQRFLKTGERATEYDTPAFRVLMQRVTTEEDLRLAKIKVTDPERNSNGSLCQQHRDGCVGDPRFYHWGDGPGLIRREVLFTSRNGATISGHVWATEAGPAKRPAILINSGSVQAPEELWGWAGAVLARHGYVVLTWDPQGQGYSDTTGACSDAFPDLGDCPDRLDGVPAQADPQQPFYLGSQDALDFLLSTRDAPYAPRRSVNGLDHSGKQRRRVAAGRNAAFNPLWELVDAQRVGVAGNSLGASSASELSMVDERIDAVVGWDNLRGGSAASPFPGAGATKPRVPGLGIGNDYGLDVTPMLSRPSPDAALSGFTAFKAAGVDTMQLVVRGGTHFESAYIPNRKFGATRYGLDLTAWYTTAWFDHYVKGDATALDRLLTDRWRRDPRVKAIEEATGVAARGKGDPNHLSALKTSKAWLGSAGFTCEDLRAGCAGGLRPDAGPAAPYGVFADAFGGGPVPGTDLVSELGTPLRVP